MSKNEKISDFDYLTHLRQQYDFLTSDVLQYENGKSHFGAKIAATLRTIFHETISSKSILPQLAEKSGIKLKFKSKRQDFIVDPHLTLYLGFMVGKRIMPRDYFNAPFFIDIDFETYWNAVVYKEGDIIYTRKQMILFTANKWGGSHVDPEIPSKFLKLIDSSAPKLISKAYGEETIITRVVYETSVQVLILLQNLIPTLEGIIVP
ncbi:MAG TPA: hypothetical protein ENI07_15730 [Desulfobacterales bacterium]|nr:hypothetical protein [Desulfobacterales bacterium]